MVGVGEFDAVFEFFLGDRVVCIEHDCSIALEGQFLWIQNLKGADQLRLAVEADGYSCGSFFFHASRMGLPDMVE